MRIRGIASTASLVLTAALVSTAFAQPPATPAKPGGTPAQPATPSKPAETPKKPPADSKDLLAVLEGTGQHATLIKAVKAAGLETALHSTSPHTVFAPTDDAFKKLPAGKLDDLLKPENKDKLAAVLKYHLLTGNVMAADLTKMKESPKTMQGSTFTVEQKDGKVMVGNDPKAMATVTKTDVKASNGVVHVIDAVMMPKESTAAAPKTEAPKTPSSGH